MSISANKRSYSVAAVLMIALPLLLFRRPELLGSVPRFWAEEGRVYFAYAFSHSFLDNLLSQFFGYYTLIPNLATGLAALLPLEDAPYMTTMIAMLVQLQVMLLVATTDSRMFPATWHKMLLASAMLLVSTGDVWLNTINSMYWLGIGTFLILIDEAEHSSKTALWFRRIYLAVAGFTGVVSCFMTPVFLLKWWWEKRKESLLHGCILAFASLVQLSTLAYSFKHSTNMLGLEGRFSAPSSFSFLRIAATNLFEPFFIGGWITSDAVVNFDLRFLQLTQDLAGAHPLKFYRMSVLIVEGLFLLLLLVLFYRQRLDRSSQYTLLSYLLVVTLSTVSSLFMESAPRYALAPSCMLLTIMVGSTLSGRAGGHILNLITGMTIVAIFIISCSSYRGRINKYFLPNVPWYTEVAQWRNDRSYKPRIWPGGWDVELKRRE